MDEIKTYSIAIHVRYEQIKCQFASVPRKLSPSLTAVQLALYSGSILQNLLLWKNLFGSTMLPSLASLVQSIEISELSLYVQHPRTGCLLSIFLVPVTHTRLGLKFFCRHNKDFILIKLSKWRKEVLGWFPKLQNSTSWSKPGLAMF